MEIAEQAEQAVHHHLSPVRMLLLITRLFFFSLCISTEDGMFFETGWC